jgi:hypothetical protein
MTALSCSPDEKAQQAAADQKTIFRLPAKARTALGKQGAAVA